MPRPIRFKPNKARDREAIIAEKKDLEGRLMATQDGNERAKILMKLGDLDHRLARLPAFVSNGNGKDG